MEYFESGNPLTAAIERPVDNKQTRSPGARDMGSSPTAVFMCNLSLTFPAEYKYSGANLYVEKAHVQLQAPLDQRPTYFELGLNTALRIASLKGIDTNFARTNPRVLYE